MAVWFKVLRVRIGVCRSTNNELFESFGKNASISHENSFCQCCQCFFFPISWATNPSTGTAGEGDMSWLGVMISVGHGLNCTLSAPKKIGLLLRTIPGKFTKKCGMWPWWKITPQLMWSYSYVWIGWVIQWWEDSSVRPSKWLNIAPLNHGPKWRVETAGSVGEAHFGGPGSFWQHSACVGCWGIWFSFEKVTIFGTKPSNYIDLFYLGWNWYDNLASC